MERKKEIEIFSYLTAAVFPLFPFFPSPGEITKSTPLCLLPLSRSLLSFTFLLSGIRQFHNVHQASKRFFASSVAFTQQHFCHAFDREASWSNFIPHPEDRREKKQKEREKEAEGMEL